MSGNLLKNFNNVDKYITFITDGSGVVSNGQGATITKTATAGQYSVVFAESFLAVQIVSAESQNALGSVDQVRLVSYTSGTKTAVLEFITDNSPAFTLSSAIEIKFSARL